MAATITVNEVATTSRVDELEQELREFESSEAVRAAQVAADIAEVHHEVLAETAKRIYLEECINNTLDKYHRWLIALSITTGSSILTTVLLLIYVLSVR